MTETKRFRFSDLVADTVRTHHGAFAYVYVLEQLESKRGHDRQLWRDVLDELERKDDEIPRVQPTTERGE